MVGSHSLYTASWRCRTTLFPCGGVPQLSLWPRELVLRYGRGSPTLFNGRPVKEQRLGWGYATGVISLPVGRANSSASSSMWVSPIPTAKSIMRASAASRELVTRRCDRRTGWLPHARMTAEVIATLTTWRQNYLCGFGLAICTPNWLRPCVKRRYWSTSGHLRIHWLLKTPYLCAVDHRRTAGLVVDWLFALAHALVLPSSCKACDWKPVRGSAGIHVNSRQ